MIELFKKDLFIADPWPAAYIKSMDALVLADLHIGVEGALIEEGIFLPRTISETTMKLVYDALSSYTPSKIILDGDIKHGFGLLNTSEWILIKNFFRELINRKLDIIVIRGNHDNYLGVLLDKFGLSLLERYDHGEYTFVHGHKMIALDDVNKVLIIGHEHPSINLRDDLGTKYKFKCFLWGEYKDHKILVLPSVGELASGSLISLYESTDEILSPILRHVDLHKFKPYALVPGKIVKELPSLDELSDHIH